MRSLFGGSGEKRPGSVPGEFPSADIHCSRRRQVVRLGLSGTFTLAELGEVLSHADFSPSRKLHRALNLDGGSSSGLYFERGSGDPVGIEPYKTVRNFVGIVPRVKAE